MKLRVVLLALTLVVLCAVSVNAGLVPPVKLAQLDIYDNGSSTANDCAVIKNHVYVISSIDPFTEPNMCVVDVSNPSAPFVSNEGLNIGPHAGGCDIQDGYLYAGMWHEGFAVVDTHNSDSLDLRSLTGVGNYCWSADAVGHRAYVSCYAAGDNANNGIYVLDIRNPNSPVILGSYKALQYEGPATAKGNIVYAGDDRYLVTLDASNPGSIVELGRIDLLYTISKIEVQGDYLYVGTYTTDLYNSTFTVLDISQPWSPVVVGQMLHDCEARDMWISGNTAFISMSWGLVRFDITKPPLRE